MPQQIIISSTPEEVRMGLVNNGILQEFMVERAMSAHLVGSIFLGRVSNVVKGIQAAFIDIGLDQNAFLYLGDSSDLTEGASVMIQITKDPRGTKGPTASREITFPGHYAVLFPFSDYIGISRKINDEQERIRLRKIAEQCKPDGMGIVMRTEAEGIEAEVLEADIRSLLAEWNVVAARAKRAKAPAFLHRELDLSVRMVRDYFTRDVTGSAGRDAGRRGYGAAPVGQRGRCVFRLWSGRRAGFSGGSPGGTAQRRVSGDRPYRGHDRD